MSTAASGVNLTSVTIIDLHVQLRISFLAKDMGGGMRVNLKSLRLPSSARKPQMVPPFLVFAFPPLFE